MSSKRVRVWIPIILAGLGSVWVAETGVATELRVPNHAAGQVLKSDETHSAPMLVKQRGMAATAQVEDTPDTDGDGVPDTEDAFPNDPGEFVDSDGDGIGNFADKDEDEDGVPDKQDAFPFDPSASSLSDTQEIEPNDEIGQALPVTLPSRVVGSLSGSGDVDFIRLPALPEGSDQRAVTAILRSSTGDAELYLRSYQGSSLQDDSRDARSSLTGFVLADDHIDAAALLSITQLTYDYYYVAVGASSMDGAAVDYQLDLAIDTDRDTVPDSRELALGMKPENPDSDGDGIFDAGELTGPLDADGDHVPNWLSADADGDGIADSLETAADVDGDGLGNLADTDSDGNGVSDLVEAGSDPMQPLDNDNDNLADYVDLDDDADLVLDVHDAQRLQPPRDYELTAGDAPTIHDFISQSPDGSELVGVATLGASLTITGENFHPDPQKNVVVFTHDLGKRFNGEGRFVNVIPDAASSDMLELTVPEDAGPYVFVVSDDWRSNRLEIELREPTAPTLSGLQPASAEPGATISLSGSGFTSDAVALLDDRTLATAYVDSSQLEVTLPADAESGFIRVQDGGKKTQGRPLDVRMPVTVDIVLPPGLSIPPEELAVLYGQGESAAVGTDGQVAVAAKRDGIGSVTVVHDVDGDGVPDPLLMATTLPGDTTLTVDPESTALALVLTPLAAIGNVPPADVAAMRAQLRTLPAVQALADALRQGLAQNPKFLVQPDAAFNEFRREAMDAVRAALAGGDQSSAETTAPHSIAGLSAAGDDNPEITPVEAHDIKVFALRHDNDEPTGNIGVENDTALYLSAEIRDERTEQILASHVSTPFDPLMVNAQAGLTGLFRAGQQDAYGEPRFRDADIAVISAGSGSGGTPPSSADIAAQLPIFLRTGISQVVVPVLNGVLDLQGGDALARKLLLAYSDATITAVENLVRAGDYRRALSELTEQFISDLVQGGPIRGALLEALNLSLTDLSERFLPRLLPYVGQISLSLDLGPAGVDISRALVDYASIPPRLDFEVRWPIELKETKSLLTTWDLVNGRASQIVYGQGFLPRPDASEPDGVIEPELVVRFGDPQAAGTQLPADSVDDQGRSLITDIAPEPRLLDINAGEPGDKMYASVELGPSASPQKTYVWVESSRECTDNITITVVGWEYFLDDRSNAELAEWQCSYLQ